MFGTSSLKNGSVQIFKQGIDHLYYIAVSALPIINSSGKGQ